MVLAVKYCGGCNASYDRVAMVERIRREFPTITVVGAEDRDEEEKADLVLVVCGCSAVCAAHGHLEGKHGKILTACEGDFAKVHEIIDSFPT